MNAWSTAIWLVVRPSCQAAGSADDQTSGGDLSLASASLSPIHSQLQGQALLLSGFHLSSSTQIRVQVTSLGLGEPWPWGTDTFSFSLRNVPPSTRAAEQQLASGPYTNPHFQPWLHKLHIHEPRITLPPSRTCCAHRTDACYSQALTGSRRTIPDPVTSSNTDKQLPESECQGKAWQPLSPALHKWPTSTANACPNLHELEVALLLAAIVC